MKPQAIGLMMITLFAFGCEKEKPNGKPSITSTVPPVEEPVDYNQAPREAIAAIRASPAIRLLALGAADPGAESTFRDWTIVKEERIDDAEKRTKIADELEAATIDYAGMYSEPIEPDFGIQVTDSGKTYDFVVSFRDGQIQWFIDDQKQEVIDTDYAPRKFFAELLGITLPDEIEEPLP